MGAYHNLHLGPYLRCPSKAIIETYSVIGCPNCKKPSQLPFCGLCGTKTDSYDVQKETTLSPYNVLNDERLRPVMDMSGEFVSNSEIFISNIRIAGLPKTEDEPFIQVTQERMTKEIEVFSITFSKEIDQLKQAYGEAVVEWGFLQWYS